MKTNLTNFRKVIDGSTRPSGIFLTVINEKGNIKSANAHMLKNLGLADPTTVQSNFFDLVHPVHRDNFKKAVKAAGALENASDVEVYVKNGQYHPMKWQVNCLENDKENERTYLCLGYKIVDEERLKRFNRLLKNNCPLVVEGLSGILFHDRNGDLIATNQKAAQIFNTTLERLYQVSDIAKAWTNIWQITDENGQLVPFHDAPFMKAIETQTVQQKTMLIKTGNGDDRWILFNSQPIPDEDKSGQFAVVSNIVDVTTERHVTSRLEHHEELISTFFEESPIITWVIDQDANLVFASDVFYQQFGHKKEDCVGAPIADLVPPSFVKALGKHHATVSDTGKSVNITENFKWADGNVYVSHITLFPIGAGTGRKLVAGQAVNLPDKSRLEKELLDLQSRVFTLARATSDAIWEWDMQTGQIFRNDVLLEMIGFQVDNSKGLSWWLRGIHPDDRNRVADTVKEATENLQQSWQEKYRFKCADGTYKYVEDKGFVVYENGLPVKMIGSLQDVSVLKELEMKLADERLLRQKELSETVIIVQENERTRFGHELHDNVNQILSTAKLFLDMVTPAVKDQQQFKQKSIDYLLMAIEEIRNLSRELVAPKLKEETLSNSIKTLIGDLSLAHEMTIRFKHDTEADLLSEGKKVTLFRIVQEQLKNIIKHSKAKNTDIILQTKDGVVQLIVKDDGQGFDPHEQCNGIGLLNIQERVQFYHGKVEIDSSPGNGCLLIVGLPMDDL